MSLHRRRAFRRRHQWAACVAACQHQPAHALRMTRGIGDGDRNAPCLLSRHRRRPFDSAYASTHIPLVQPSALAPLRSEVKETTTSPPAPRRRASGSAPAPRASRAARRGCGRAASTPTTGMISVPIEAVEAGKRAGLRTSTRSRRRTARRSCRPSAASPAARAPRNPVARTRAGTHDRHAADGDLPGGERDRRQAERKAFGQNRAERHHTVADERQRHARPLVERWHRTRPRRTGWRDRDSRNRQAPPHAAAKTARFSINKRQQRHPHRHGGRDHGGFAAAQPQQRQSEINDAHVPTVSNASTDEPRPAARAARACSRRRAKRHQRQRAAPTIPLQPRADSGGSSVRTASSPASSAPSRPSRDHQKGEAGGGEFAGFLGGP